MICSEAFAKLKNLIPDADYRISVYASRQRQKSVPRELNFRTIPLLAPPTDFQVNYTTPIGALLTWKMEHSEFIDGYELSIFNKEIRTMVDMFHIPHNQTQILLNELHWETKYRVTLFAVRGNRIWCS